MEVFLSAAAGALVGSCVALLGSIVVLRAERKTALTSLRVQDEQLALAEFPLALQQWVRPAHHLFGPLGRPGSDELQEVELRHQVHLQGLRHRLPKDFEVGPEVDRLLEMYHEWISTWIDVPEPSPEQLKLPDHISTHAAEIPIKFAEEARRFRAQLG